MIKIIEIKKVIDKIEEDFEFLGGPVDFMSEFRTKAQELQDVHHSEDGESCFVNSPTFIGSPGGFAPMSISVLAGTGLLGDGAVVEPEEIAGPQTEAAFEKFCNWLRDEGKLD